MGYWLNYVNVIGYLFLVAYLALYPAIFGFFAVAWCGQSSDHGVTLVGHRIRIALYLAAFWVGLEYLRGLVIGGLPWALLGYSQWRNIAFIQIADIVGAWGVSFFVALINLCLYQAISNFFLGNRKIARKFLVWLGIMGLVLMIYGEWTLYQRELFYKDGRPKAVLRVAVVQGNIPQEQKWDNRIKNIIFEKYRRLTLMAAGEKSDLIVWPETSFPGFLEDEPVMAAQLRGLVRQSRTYVLAGAPTFGDLEGGLKFYNSAILYGPNGEERKRYSKLHLVPFGEYVPFEPLIGFIRNFVSIGHFSPGVECVVFETKSLYEKIPITAKFGTLICYEDIFPGLVRSFCENGADFLVNITNDAWFGKTAAPYQHAQASVFRAVENRMPVIRSTNTGYSCFISAEGRILSSVQDNGEEINVTAHKSQEIILRKGRSFYTRAGDAFMFLVLFLVVLAYRERNRNARYERF